jgi:steroid 5-alpha reductase family enzyme
MSATTFTGSARNDQSWTRAKRTVLVAAAIVVLFAVSFFIGRATSTTQHVATITPASAQVAGTGAQLSPADRAQIANDGSQQLSQANTTACIAGRPC